MSYVTLVLASSKVCYTFNTVLSQAQVGVQEAWQIGGLTTLRTAKNFFNVWPPKHYE